MLHRTLCAPIALAVALATSAAAPTTVFTYTPAMEEALGYISADSLRGNLSFLASDLLEGRDTPSRGLDIAAEYIAAQFRKANLEPAGDDGYFQTAPFLVSEAKPETFELKLEAGGETVTAAGEVSLESAGALDIARAEAVRVGLDDVGPLPAAEAVAGRVVFAEWPGYRTAAMRRLRALRALKPALVVTLDRRGNATRGAEKHRLVDPEERAAAAPWVMVHNDALAKAVGKTLAGASVSVRLAAPVETPVKLRNVVGLLRGSDPALRDTYVLLTAHYDHIGRKPGCTRGDCIYNGANDDASGTVSVIEVAHALAALKERPRRSIIFMTVFGEEEGSYGARYYTRHPLFPLEKTVADVNLEQLGRTDADEGPQVASATFTGYGFSDLPKVFQAAGKHTGIKVHDTADSDDYFNRSDNVTFALAGIPAHTLSVAYTYPDYHGLGDNWEKIDYANMAKVDRMVALGVIMLAGREALPRWNVSDAKTAAYVQAWRERHAAGE